MSTMLPIQPIEKDEKGVPRFRANAIVRFLLDNGPFDMNDLATREFDQADREQFAQLIGYSLGGFGELSYVRDETYAVADRMANRDQTQVEATVCNQNILLAEARHLTRQLAGTLFRIHPDDLEE